MIIKITASNLHKGIKWLAMGIVNVYMIKDKNKSFLKNTGMPINTVKQEKLSEFISTKKGMPWEKSKAFFSRHILNLSKEFVNKW